MNKLAKYMSVSLLTIASFLPISCKFINSNKSSKVDYKPKIEEIVYGEFKDALRNPNRGADIDWFINNKFVDPNLIGRNGENLRELKRCLLSLMFSPLQAALEDKTTKDKIGFASGSTINNYPDIISTFFEGDTLALDNLDQFVVVDFNALLKEEDRSQFAIFVFKKDEFGNYRPYTNKTIISMYKNSISEFYTRAIYSNNLERKRLSKKLGCEEIIKYKLN